MADVISPGTGLYFALSWLATQLGPSPSVEAPMPPDAGLATSATTTTAALENPPAPIPVPAPAPARPALEASKPPPSRDQKAATVTPVSSAPAVTRLPTELVGPPAPRREPARQDVTNDEPRSSIPEGWVSSLIFALLLLAVARVSNALRRGLLEHGLLPRVLSAAQVLLRLGAILVVLAAILRHVPPEARPLLPWALVAIVAALGWSLREVLPDLLAGLVLQVERRVRAGQWVAAATYRGEVLEIGFRSSRLRESSGRILTLPNRRLISEPVEVELGPGPTVEVRVQVPMEISPARVHKALREATLLVPWLAPEARIETRRAEENGVWIVQTQIIEGRYEEAFAGALREQVDEMWGIVDSSRPSLPPPPAPRKPPASGFTES